MSNFWEELKRRNVIRETLAYVLVAWVLLQVSDIVLPIFEAPPWILKTLTIVLIVGVPIVMIISWVYELTDKGIRKTADLDDPKSGKKQKRILNILIGVAAITAIALFLAIGSKVKEMEGPPQYSIAVLPFKNISPNDSTQWFIDGLREDIWDRLVRIEGMEPRSLRSAEALHESSTPNQEMAVKLNTRYLLEGSVRQFGDQAIINVSLWNTEQELFWQEEYNEPFDNLLFLQRRLARDVVDAMDFSVGPKENEILEASSTDDLEAYLLVKKGERLVLNNRSGDAVPYLKDAVRRDPNYADAYGNLAYAYTTMAWHYADSHHGDVQLTRAYADSALALDPNNSPALGALATLYHIVFNKEEKAGEFNKKALEKRPNDPILNYETGLYYYFRRSPDKARSLQHFRRAYELDPIEWKYARELMLLYADLGRHQEAMDVLNESYMYFHFEPSLTKAFWTSELAMYQDGNRDAQLKFKLEQIAEDSLDPGRYTQLAIHYDWYLNDNANFLKYSQKAYELDPGRVVHYISALLENGMFDEAREVFKTGAFKKQSKPRQIMCHQNYYSLKGEYDNLKSLIDTTALSQDSLNYVFYLAQSGKIKDLESIGFKQYAQLSWADKAKLYAMLGMRDSLYYYLEHPMIEGFLRVNSNPTFDPYRKEARYIAFREKYYLEDKSIE